MTASLVMAPVVIAVVGFVMVPIICGTMLKH
jgi:hypothetical protein